MIGQVHGLDAEMARECTLPTLADDLDLHYLNHVLHVDPLFKSQSMGVLAAVEPSKGTTVWTAVDAHVRNISSNPRNK